MKSWLRNSQDRGVPSEDKIVTALFVITPAHYLIYMEIYNMIQIYLRSSQRGIATFKDASKTTDLWWLSWLERQNQTFLSFLLKG